MRHNRKYQCRRREHPAMQESIGKGVELFGAGSGGDDGDGSVAHYTDQLFNVHSEAVYLHAEPGENAHGYSNCISLLAGGDSGDGRVYAHGSQGVRLTAGPPGQPPSNNKDISGLEMQCGDEQTIHILRGMDENPSHGSMFFGPIGIIISANPCRTECFPRTPSAN
jgi:hypothetical protein